MSLHLRILSAIGILLGALKSHLTSHLRFITMTYSCEKLLTEWPQTCRPPIPEDSFQALLLSPLATQTLSAYCTKAWPICHRPACPWLQQTTPVAKIPIAQARVWGRPRKWCSPPSSQPWSESSCCYSCSSFVSLALRGSKSTERRWLKDVSLTKSTRMRRPE